MSFLLAWIAPKLYHFCHVLYLWLGSRSFRALISNKFPLIQITQLVQKSLNLALSQATLTASSTTILLPTQPTIQPIQLTAQSIQSTAQPTFLRDEELVTQPTQPTIQPTQPSVEPSQQTSQPAQPTIQQTQRPTLEYFNSCNIDYYGYQKGPKNVY